MSGVNLRHPSLDEALLFLDRLQEIMDYTNAARYVLLNDRWAVASSYDITARVGTDTGGNNCQVSISTNSDNTFAISLSKNVSGSPVNSTQYTKQGAVDWDKYLNDFAGWR